jgi:hypothetical protein
MTKTSLVTAQLEQLLNKKGRAINAPALRSIFAEKGH